ncbi:hypothetical protein BKA59DRAFT_425859 [Fusarium tricinctum]|uniref:Uncharacterized protein n=1 Tax=Fusarium tricinctum TaxID=61284 RepID=A0A8K0W7B8_9HYPO|nr:hypothetical protein BKA59DRAFT_425859 [Fusarium tricinctum]
MEGHNDNAARCLPKIPKLFTKTDHPPEVILFSASAPDEDLIKSHVVHGLTTCETHEDNTQQNDGQKERTPPSTALYSTLMSPGDGKAMVFTIKKERSSQGDATVSPPSDVSTHSSDNILEETVQKLNSIANKVRKMSASLINNKEDTSDCTTSTEQSGKAGSALPSQDQPPQPLTRSRLRSIPDTKLYNLGALSGRLQNTIDDSHAATIRSDTSRPADMDDHSTDSSETPRTAAEAECPAYYIFDPHSSGMAYYMYRDGDEKEGYKIEKVSFKLTSPEPGVRTYHLEASANDHSEVMGDNQETLWRFDSSHIPAVIIDPERSASREAEADDDEPLYAGEEATQSIARKVSDRLQKIRHLREHVYVINGKGQYVPEARGLYLIGDKDIRDVVSIVLDETLKNDHANGPERPTATTESSESPPLPRLDESSQAIFVASPMAIDPATTINLPKTSYANINATDMQVHTKTRGTASEATTTVITRRSVAEITWARAYPTGYDLDSRTRGRTVSDYCSPTHGGSGSCSDDRQQSHPKTAKGDFVLRQYATSKSTAEILADIMCNKSFEQQLRVSHGTVITSFPRLFSRDCTTTGWFNSPVDTEDTEKFGPSNLYKHGVDAHSGFDETPSSGSPGETPKPSPYNDAHFYANPFNAGFNTMPIEDSPFPTLAAERRLSASLDADSRRRRSIQVIGIKEETLDDRNGPRPSLMRKIKQGSHKFFHKHHFREPSGTVPSITSEEDDSQDGDGLRSRGSNIGQPSQLSPRPDDLGIREAVVENRLHVPGRREGTCSEDNQPHECVNDLSSREISPK